MGKTHVVLGVSAGALCALAAHPWTTPGIALLCIPVGALAGPGPDVDHHAAPARAVAVAALAAVALAQPWVLVAYAAPVAYRVVRVALGRPPTHLELAWSAFWRHRGGTHRILTAAGVGGVVCAAVYLAGPATLAAAGWVAGAAVTAGWLSHIYGDARTHSGISVGRWDDLTIGRTVRTGSRCPGCAAQVANRRRRRKRWAPHESSEQHLLRYRFQPAALVLTAAALFIISTPLAQHP